MPRQLQSLRPYHDPENSTGYKVSPDAGWTTALPSATPCVQWPLIQALSHFRVACIHSVRGVPRTIAYRAHTQSLNVCLSTRGPKEGALEVSRIPGILQIRGFRRQSVRRQKIQRVSSTCHIRSSGRDRDEGTRAQGDRRRLQAWWHPISTSGKIPRRSPR